MQTCHLLQQTTLIGQSTQYYTDANDDLLAKNQIQMSLFLLFFMLVQLILFCFIGNMQRVNLMYFCINNVYIWLNNIKMILSATKFNCKAKSN